MNTIMMIAKTIWKPIGKRQTASVLVKDTPGQKLGVDPVGKWCGEGRGGYRS